MKNELCIIGVYFGTLPHYFPLWLKSCAANPTVDFHIFTDQQLDDLPENVCTHPMTLEKMRDLAGEKLQLPVCLERHYKCCDFKAVYGVIFQDYVREYSYWGHCDFDLIFGNLQELFEQYGLKKYDRFLTLGHLCMYKNTSEVNSRYRCPGAEVDYLAAFTKPEIAVFDELPGMTKIYQENGFSQFVGRIFADISSVHNRYRLIEIYPLDVKPVNYNHQVFYWEKGNVYRAYVKEGSVHTEPYLYVHFKKRPNYPLTFEPEKADAFYITSRGFFPKTEAVTPEMIRKMEPYPGRFREWAEEMKHKLKSRFGR